jgi:ferredoxin
MSMGDEQQWTVVIEPVGWKFNMLASMTLLDGAKLSHYVLPSSCRNGTCRTCMCQLTGGRVRYRIEWPGLSLDEKKNGYILPCVAYPESDLAIQSPAATRLGAGKQTS